MLFINPDKIEVKKTKVTLTISNEFDNSFNSVCEDKDAFNNLIALSLLAGSSANILRQLGQEDVNFYKIKQLQSEFNNLVFKIKKEVKPIVKTHKFV